MRVVSLSVTHLLKGLGVLVQILSTPLSSLESTTDASSTQVCRRGGGAASAL
jgi:hypothetical protein